ncbi:glycosyltransferase family 2 protein [Butyrivibrio sp. WCE2006]|uniref:glycosyltransferase family 2 protein n=1 Tax=Butyrivibrio sp. WCE2006 TaxID=1410611 RepID=UPI0006794C93|nr:glycosyltransferase family 2 protein [Butyrivibrio sp. WCE2006]
MKRDLISVIVPIYNVEQYLDECIRSIVNQTYKDIEIILVDDGSPDNCGEKIDHWAKKDERVIALHKKNGGLGDSRNYGFAHSTGEYIAFIDSDDFVDNKYFEKLLTLLKQEDADMAGCRFFRNNIDNKGYRYPYPNEKYRFVGDKEYFLERLYNDFGVFCVAWGKLYKRSIITENMYPKVKISEDALIIRELAYRCNKIAYIPDALYMYRDRPNSIMTVQRKGTLENEKQVVMWLERDIDFYKGIHNNKLQAIAEKAYCYVLANDWNKLDRECQKYFQSRYFKALVHMIFNSGNRFAVKCKYMLLAFKIIFRINAW